jgi:hypothetical protein
MRAALLLFLLVLVPARAAADIVHFTLPRGVGVPKAVRGEVARAVRAVLEAAGHRLGSSRRAKYLLSTRIRKRGPRYFVSVSFRLRAEKRVQLNEGKARRDGITELVASLVEQFLPAPKPPPALEPRPPTEAAPPRPAATPWVGARPSWPDVHRPDPQQLRPFPLPEDPPPEIGDFRR